MDVTTPLKSVELPLVLRGPERHLIPGGDGAERPISSSPPFKIQIPNSKGLRFLKIFTKTGWTTFL